MKLSLIDNLEKFQAADFEVKEKNGVHEISNILTWNKIVNNPHTNCSSNNDDLKEWMKKVINEKNDCDEKLDERDFPSLDSQNHFILNEKVMMFDFGKKSENDADNDQEQCVKKKKDDISKNYEWLKQVKDEK